MTSRVVEHLKVGEFEGWGLESIRGFLSSRVEEYLKVEEYSMVEEYLKVEEYSRVREFERGVGEHPKVGEYSRFIVLVF